MTLNKRNTFIILIHYHRIKGHSMLSVAFGIIIISEKRFQYPGPISEDNEAVHYIFGISHFGSSTCFSQHIMSFEIFLT